MRRASLSVTIGLLLAAFGPSDRLSEFVLRAASGTVQPQRAVQTECRPTAPSAQAQSTYERAAANIDSKTPEARNRAYADLQTLLTAATDDPHVLFRIQVLFAMAAHPDVLPTSAVELGDAARRAATAAGCLTIGVASRLAGLYERLGAGREAVRLTESIAEELASAGLRKEEAGARYLLATALRRIGETAAARAEFQRALELGEQTGEQEFRRLALEALSRAEPPPPGPVEPGPRRVLNFSRSQKVVAASVCPALNIAATIGDASGARLQLWDVLNQGRLWSVDLTGSQVTFSDNCLRMAIVNPGGTHIVDAATGGVLETIPATGPSDFSRDGRLIWINHAVFDAETGELTASVRGVDGPAPYFRILAVDLDRGLYVATGLEPASVEIRQRDSGNVTQRLQTGDGSRATAAALSADGLSLLVGTEKGNLRFWSLRALALEGDLPLSKSAVTRVELSEHARTFAAFSKDVAIVADKRHPDRIRLIRRSPGTSSPLASVSAGPDGISLTRATDGSLLIEYFDGRPSVRLAAIASGIDAIAFTSDSSQLIMARAGTIYALDVARGRMRPYKTPGGAIGHIAVSPDGGSVFASFKGERGLVRLDRDTHKAEKLATPHGDALSSLQTIPPRKVGDAYRLLTADGKGAAALWDPNDGTVIQRFATSDGKVLGLAISADGAQVLSAGEDGAVRLWRRESGESVVLARSSTEAKSVAISQDGLRGASCSQDDELILWDLRTHARLKTWKADCSQAVRFSSDGRWLLAVANFAVRVIDIDGRHLPIDLKTGYVSAFDVATTADLIAIEGKSVLVGGLNDVRRWAAEGLPDGDTSAWAEDMDEFSLSADGESVVTLATNDNVSVVRTWDVRANRLVCEFESDDTLMDARLSPNGSLIAAPLSGGTIGLWNAKTCKPVGKLTGHAQDATLLAFSHNGRSLVSAADDGTMRLWDVALQKDTILPGHDGQVVKAAMSPDGHFVVTVGEVGDARVWNAEDGKQRHHLQLHVSQDLFDGAVAFLGRENVAVFAERNLLDSRPDATESHFGIWDIAKGAEIGRRTMFEYSTEIVGYPADSRRFVATSAHGLNVWDRESAERPIELWAEGASAPHISPDGSLLASSSDGGSVDLWHAGRFERLFSVVIADGGQWTFVEPGGRFETASFDQSTLISWVLPEQPFRANPMEYFTKDYFEPGLVTKVMTGALPPIAPPSRRSLRRPVVKIESVAETVPGEASVTVSISVPTEEPAVTPLPVDANDSKAFDLRLFLDGRLVPFDGDGSASEIPLPEGRGTVTFRKVLTPSRGCTPSVEFSAYAFNEDGVRSNVAKAVHPVAAAPDDSCRRTAFVVAVGVNSSDSPFWDLQYAVSDARRIAEELQQRIRGVDVVVPVTLVSERSRGVATATREHLRDVMQCLGEGACDSQRLKEIGGSAGLRRARPQDLVIFAVSTHGHRDDAGRFYLFPSDIGEAAGATPTPSILKSAISSDLLREWLLPIQSRVVMILDTCDARSSVDSQDFKPAPLLGRGFGRLAFDKGMKVLVATKAKEAAREVRGLKHGLLTYRLLVSGLQDEDSAADENPRNGELTLSEWLQFGEGVLEAPGASKEAVAGSQESHLFDFGDWTHDVTLVSGVGQ